MAIDPSVIHPDLGSLPPELLIEILELACASSQKTYHSLLLTCKLLHDLTRHPCLHVVPIRIVATGLSSFHDLLAKDPELALQVHHLWITGRSEKVVSVVTPCVSLVSLACSSYVLVSLLMSYSLTSPRDNLGLLGPGQIRHLALRELTLFDNWDCWFHLKEANCGKGLEICRQITHLRVHDTLAPDFPTTAFSSLTHFSSSTRPFSISFPREIAMLSSMEGLNHIVNCTFFWKMREPDQRTTDLLARVDKRLRFVYYGWDEPGEFELWSGRARRGESVWTRMKEPRMLT